MSRGKQAFDAIPYALPIAAGLWVVLIALAAAIL